MTRDEFMDVVYDELHSDGDNNRANRIIDAADDYVDEYAPYWIPVTERLPEKYKHVLVTSRGGVSMAWYNGMYFEKGASTKHRAIQTAKAWMPLPEPYKEVTE